MGAFAYFLLILWAAKSHNKKRTEGNSDTAADEHNNYPSVIPSRVQVSLSPEDRESQRTYQEEQHTLQTSLKRAAWLTFWAVFIYAGITLALLFVNNKAANAAKESADAAKSAAEAATTQTILMKQQLIGTMSSSFALSGPELIADKVRIGWAKTGQVISPEFHASFRISEASFPALKQSWESQLYRIDMKPMPSSFSDKYPMPAFAPSDRQFPTQKHTIIVKGEFSFDDGFGQIFNRQFCAVYFGFYQYTAINDGGSVTQGGFQDCRDFKEKLRQFRQRELP